MAPMNSSSSKLASMEAISAALKATEVKKANLHKAFENLQSQSSCLTSFTLQWKDMEEHFDSIQKSLMERFKELEAKEKQLVINPVKKEPSLPARELEKKRNLSNSVCLPGLKPFCIMMDGVRLRNYIMDNRKGNPEIRDEVMNAIKCGSDPGKLVLDAMEGFYPLNISDIKPGELGAIRRTCNLLLEALIVISPQISSSVKEEAKRLAFEWKQKVGIGGDTPVETFAFLQILAAFGLASEFNLDEVLELLVTVVRRKQAIDLFRVLGLIDKVPDFIKKLSSKKKHLEEVKFVYAFQLVDMFPPVPILKAHLKETKKAAEEVRKKGNNSLQAKNEAIAKELVAVKEIIKCIEEHHLESQYPRESLDKRIEQLEKLKKEKKRAAAPSAHTPIQQQQQQNEHKRPRSDVLNTTTASTSAAPYSQTYAQHMGLLPDPVPAYLSSSAHKGLLADPVPSYLGSSAQYGPGDGILGAQYRRSAGQYESGDAILGAQYRRSAGQYESGDAILGAQYRSAGQYGLGETIHNAQYITSEGQYRSRDMVLDSQYMRPEGQYRSEGVLPVPQYASSAAGQPVYRGGNPPIIGGNPSPLSVSRLYSSASLMNSDPHERPVLHSGYGLPPSHHPSYHA